MMRCKWSFKCTKAAGVGRAGSAACEHVKTRLSAVTVMTNWRAHTGRPRNSTGVWISVPLAPTQPM
eukprot:351882-Chlamydomonas_euryale.AAC.18